MIMNLVFQLNTDIYSKLCQNSFPYYVLPNNQSYQTQLLYMFTLPANLSQST